MRIKDPTSLLFYSIDFPVNQLLNFFFETLFMPKKKKKENKIK